MPPHSPLRAADRRPVVQKFGGSSLSSFEKVREVAAKIIRTHEAGTPVVAVVSAMGDTTTELVKKARAISSTPPSRELDVLLSSGERMSMALVSMAVHEAGFPAISLTGPQSGIVTDDNHSNATITEVRPERIRHELDQGRIVIVAGYQGATERGEVTTLGRGGSDTTAVALAGALGASCCEIYSDVPGVFTADPREVDGPLQLHRVGADLMTEYARHGARVLHRPCLEHAAAIGVTIRALSTFGDERSTLIARDAELALSDAPSDARPHVAGVTSRQSLARVVAPDADAGAAVRVLDLLEPYDPFREVPSSRPGELDVLVDLANAPDPVAEADELRERLAGTATVAAPVASVSVVAPPDADLGASVADALAAASIPVSRSYLHPLSVTSLVPLERRADAVAALHEALVAAPLREGAQRQEVRA